MKSRLLVICASLSLLASGCVLGGSDERLFTAEFARGYQVFPGIRVTVQGVEVGRVVSVEAAPEAVRVRFEISDPEVKIPSDVHATVVPESLLGERYIQLWPAYKGGPALRDGATIALDRTYVPAEGDELLRSMNRYFGALEAKNVTGFVVNASKILEGQGQELNDLLGYGTDVVTTLDEKRDQLARMIVQFNRITQALAARQKKLARLIETYNLVGSTINDLQDSLAGTISGLNDASSALASLLYEHRNPLKSDIATLTKTTKTLERNIHRLARTGYHATRLFRTASRAVDYDKDWLRLSNHGGELFEHLTARLQDRLVGLCLRLGVTKCSTPDFWEWKLPGLFCDQDHCPPPPLLGGAGKPAGRSPGEAIRTSPT